MVVWASGIRSLGIVNTAREGGINYLLGSTSEPPDAKLARAQNTVQWRFRDESSRAQCRLPSESTCDVKVLAEELS